MYDGADIALVFNGPAAYGGYPGSLVTRYLAGPGIDQTLAAENATGEVVWFLADSLGTVRDVARFDPATNTTSVVNHLAYDAFGKITSQSDPGRQPLFAFTGREWDPDAELYHYRARWYDPKTGRFLSEDPLGFAAGDLNLARYVGNAPTLYVDPSGMASQRQGHHPIPEEAIGILEGLHAISKEAARKFRAFTLIPEHYKHGSDSWIVDGVRVTHREYNAAMIGLLHAARHLQENKSKVLSAKTADALIEAFQTGDFSRYEAFAADHLVIIRRWHAGFLKSLSVADAIAAAARDAGVEISKDEMKAIIRQAMGGGDEKALQKTKNVMNRFAAKGYDAHALMAEAKHAFMARTARFMGFAAFVFLTKDAYAGAVGQGHHGDLTGIAGAFDNAAYEAMMGPIVETMFRKAMLEMGNSFMPQGLGPIDRKRISMGLPAYGSE